MLDSASVLDFSFSQDFYFMRHSDKGVWHIRHSGAIPEVCYCTKTGLHEIHLQSLVCVDVREICKKCLVLYTLELFQ